MKRTVVLAYSGGLDTSVCVKWLAERGYRVVAFMADIGQGEPSAQAIRRAKVAGAARVIVRDLRSEFVHDYVWPALKAHAVYEGKYVLATALSRPLIAAHLVDVAHRVGASRQTAGQQLPCDERARLVPAATAHLEVDQVHPAVEETAVVGNLGLNVLGGLAALPQLIQTDVGDVGEILGLEDCVDPASVLAHDDKATCTPRPGSDRG